MQRITILYPGVTRPRSPLRSVMTAAFLNCTAPGSRVARSSYSQKRRCALVPNCSRFYREHSVTALFCPPVLLSTLTANPEVDLPYPICRYIVPAGEAFPASLVEPWSRARRQIVNTYGPTEVSTDTSRQLLRPNEPVTIGSPFAGVSYFILGSRHIGTAAAWHRRRALHRRLSAGTGLPQSTGSHRNTVFHTPRIRSPVSIG